MSFLDIASGIHAKNLPVFLTETQEIQFINNVHEAFMDIFDNKFGVYANRVSDKWYEVMVECVNAEVSYRQNHTVDKSVSLGEIAITVFMDLYNTTSLEQ